MTEERTEPNWATMTETELRDAEAPWPKTYEELTDFIRTMAERPHDYGTCVYAVSLAATAAFNLVAHLQGITGAQSSFADLDIIRRTRGLKMGGRILDYEKLLYPQYCNAESFPGVNDLLASQAAELAKEAQRRLDEGPGAHTNVLLHWRRLAANAPDSTRQEV